MSSRGEAARRARPDLEPLGDRLVPATYFHAVGQDVGGTSLVQVYTDDGHLARTLSPYGPDFTGGARVATADVTGDGTDDVIVAPGPGGGPRVKVYDGVTGDVVRDFFAYEATFFGGVNVAAGDVTGDGRADLVTGTGVGGGPRVTTFDGATCDVLDDFFAYEPNFRGGVNVAAGDVTGDGKADVVTGTGVGGGPRVQVFDALSAREIDNFFAYDPGVRGGVTVGAGDLDGDGEAEIVTGTGAGGGPNVVVFDGPTTAVRASFPVYRNDFANGTSVAVVHADGANEVMVAPGPSFGGHVLLFDESGTLVNGFLPFLGFRGGVTTGQGVATADAPLSWAFAYWVPFLGRGGGTPTDDGTTGDTGSAPPIDTGSAPPTDTSTSDPGAVPWYLDPNYDYPYYYNYDNSEPGS